MADWLVNREAHDSGMIGELVSAWRWDDRWPGKCMVVGR